MQQAIEGNYEPYQISASYDQDMLGLDGISNGYQFLAKQNIMKLWSFKFWDLSNFASFFSPKELTYYEPELKQ